MKNTVAYDGQPVSKEFRKTSKRQYKKLLAQDRKEFFAMAVPDGA